MFSTRIWRSSHAHHAHTHAIRRCTREQTHNARIHTEYGFSMVSSKGQAPSSSAVPKSDFQRSRRRTQSLVASPNNADGAFVLHGCCLFMPA